LKLTYALDATKRQVIQNVDIQMKQKQIKLIVYYKKNPSAESYQAEKQKKHFEKAINKKVVLQFNQLN